MIYNIKVTTRLERYEEYHSQIIGNLIRPSASAIIDSKNILEEIIENKKIDENQYQSLELNQVKFITKFEELRYFAIKVIDTEQKYDIASAHIDLLNYLRTFKYDNEFFNGQLDYKNPKEKKLANKELEKFLSMKQVMTDYSNIFIKELGDYKTGKLENSSHLYDYEYNVNNEKWILVLSKIFQYNRDSQYKDEF